MEWMLEILLIGLLAATLFHALRLERALGVLKRDRTALEELVAGFNGATRQAESGIERLRDAADGAGRHVARQVELGRTLKDDLQFLTERGEKLADRLDGLVRAGRGAATEARRPPPASTPAPDMRYPAYAAAEPAAEVQHMRVRSQAERDLLKALRLAR